MAFAHPMFPACFGHQRRPPAVKRSIWRKPTRRRRRRRSSPTGPSPSGSTSPRPELPRMPARLLRDVVRPASTSGDSGVGPGRQHVRCAVAAAHVVTATPASISPSYWCSAGVAHCRNHDPGIGRARLTEAVDLFQARGDTVGAARALIELVHGEVTWGSFGRTVNIGLLESRLPVIEQHDVVLAARGYVQLAEALWPQFRISRAERVTRLMLWISSPRPTTPAFARVRSCAQQARWVKLDLRGALDALLAALDTANESGDPWLREFPLTRIALTLFWLGRLDEAESYRVRRVCTPSGPQTGQSRAWRSRRSRVCRRRPRRVRGGRAVRRSGARSDPAVPLYMERAHCVSGARDGAYPSGRRARCTLRARSVDRDRGRARRRVVCRHHRAGRSVDRRARRGIKSRARHSERPTVVGHR